MMVRKKEFGYKDYSKSWRLVNLPQFFFPAKTHVFQKLEKSITNSIKIFCDNYGSIKLAQNPIFHFRTEHIEIHHHFFWEQVLEGKKIIVYSYKYTTGQYTYQTFRKNKIWDAY